MYSRCADITNLPLGCQQVKKAGECCPSIQCSNGQTGTFQGSQTQPGTIGGYPVPQPHPTAAPTPGPGLTFGPGIQPTVIPNVGSHALGKDYKATYNSYMTRCFKYKIYILPGFNFLTQSHETLLKHKHNHACFRFQRAAFTKEFFTQLVCDGVMVVIILAYAQMEKLDSTDVHRSKT